VDIVKAIVQKVIAQGPKGPYAVATSEALEGSVTISLEPTVWQEKDWPEAGNVVLLSKIRQKRAGWRAKAGRYYLPSDEQQQLAKRKSKRKTMNRFTCNCGFNQTAYSFCRQCGQKLPDQFKTTNSESLIEHDKLPTFVHKICFDAGAKFCPHCGENLQKEKQKDSQWINDKILVQENLQKEKQKEILLVLLLLDDSGSIEHSGNTQAVIDGYNGFIEALKGALGEVRIKTMFLNNMVETPFQNPNEVHQLTWRTYRPANRTPLYLRSIQALDVIIKESRDLARNGTIVRTMTFIFTDGGDNESEGIKSTNVKIMVDMMLTTGTHSIGGCAVNDGHTNFWQVFASMGIPEHWIKVLKNDPNEISEGMAQMGQSVSDASTNYSQASQTGFRR